jgi:hypothetical protein
MVGSCLPGSAGQAALKAHSTDVCNGLTAHVSNSSAAAPFVLDGLLKLKQATADAKHIAIYSHVIRSRSWWRPFLPLLQRGCHQ